MSITFDAASKLDKVVTLPYTILPTLLIPYIENYIILFNFICSHKK